MLEEYEARTERINLPKSAIEIPDQSWKTVEDVMGNVESQLVLFEAHTEACPIDVTSSVYKELRIKAIYWAAVRACLPRTKTDTFIARLYGILAKRAKAKQTFKKQSSQNMWRRRNQERDFDVSNEHNSTQHISTLKTRTPTNSLDVRLGAKRIQDVNPSLGPCLQEDVDA
ncbi:uncharacterized protein LOC127842973 [Dreissena polymorpha]|uniref:uncharacterized protein LOC127842973 n=1 Tax=Dreissena polymorpha TaxID=45954 RepID=UPI0022640391|nr:uncharacterized protein LOC127842973 [Dreissena polymorpha]